MLRFTFATTLLLITSFSCEAQRLTDKKYQELLQEVRYQGNEVWREIPWKTSLLDAQRLAAKSKKPIFIWAMDGHPLGCT